MSPHKGQISEPPNGPRSNDLSSSASGVKLARRLESLYVALVSDVLDSMGKPDQVLSQGIRPLIPTWKIAGPAFTGKTRRYPKYTPVKDESWMKYLVEMIEAVRPGNVFVTGAGNRPGNATWGELMSNGGKQNGAVGAITDSSVRDVQKILEIKPDFPVWAQGITPSDSKGRSEFVDYDVPIDCGGVRVHPGDIVFADYDGVVVVPLEIADETVTKAEELYSAEKAFRGAVRHGMKVSEAQKKFHVF
jgi:4-hydroxy-4-methyl-2-oxoglutarate aldolase